MKLNCQTAPAAAAAQKKLDDFLERAKKMIVVTASATDAAKPVPVPAALPLEAPSKPPTRSKFDELLNSSNKKES